MLTIAGGKLTGYRKMSETVTNLLAKDLQVEGQGPFEPSKTRTLPISGGDVGGSKGYTAFVRNMTEEGVKLGLSHEAAGHIARRYGSNAKAVFQYIPAQLD